MKVKKLHFNWRQVGSTIDRDGAGEDYDLFTVGRDGCVSIVENEPKNDGERWNYIVSLENGTRCRIFNPNFVEYFPEENK